MKNLKPKYGILIVLLGIFFSFCSTNPQPINYGKDACHFCQMTIVDKVYGAEIITNKGKIFKFDAAECLIRHKSTLENVEGYQFLTNYFEAPGEFAKLNEVKFLISENLPSPMGAFLTAFKTEETANKLKVEKSGEIYSLDEIEKILLKK